MARLRPGTKTNVTIQAYPGEAVWFDGAIIQTGWTAGSGVDLALLVGL